MQYAISKIYHVYLLKIMIVLYIDNNGIKI